MRRFTTACLPIVLCLCFPVVPSLAEPTAVSAPAGGAAAKPAPACRRVIATDYPTLQDAVNALPDRTGEVYLPAGNYVLTKTLDLSYPSGGYKGGIKLVGAGRTTKIVAATKGQPAIDLTGANHCIIQDLNIEAEGNLVKPADAPNIGLLLARNPSGHAAQEHRFTNVNIIGRFTIANVYNITSELDRFVGCIFINTAPGSHNMVFSSDNYAGVESPYRGKIKTLYSNTELRIIGCSFYNWGGGKGGSNLYMRGFTMDVTVRDCYMNPPAGGNGVRLGMSSKGGPIRGAVFDGIRVEADNSSDVFRIEGNAANITIRECRVFYGEGKALNADSVSFLTFENNDCWNIRGWKTAVHAGAMSNSRIVGNLFKFDNWGGKNPQDAAPLAVSVQRSMGNHIQVPSRELARLGWVVRTVIDATDDGGVRRRYLGDFATGETLNLTPVNTAKLKGMKRGDVALDDGTNTASRKPGLAVYDGKEWAYMN